MQHKQIRSRDLQDRDSPDDSFLGIADLSYQRDQFSTALPPSGSSANTTLWSEGSRRNTVDSESALETSSQQNHEENVGFVTATTADSPEITGHSDEEVSPLSTLVQLQNALPDISVQGSTNN